MERNITITLEKAREWYNSDNILLKELALQVFNTNELFEYTTIKTFKDACDTLNIDYRHADDLIQYIAESSKASAAMFKLNIIRKALNLGQDLHLAEDTKGSCIYDPLNPIAIELSTYTFKAKGGEVIGKATMEGKIYEIYGNLVSGNTLSGLGCFEFETTGYAYADAGFLGCATKEIAQHFSKYFGMLITEAKYGDIVDFEIVENKYQ